MLSFDYSIRVSQRAKRIRLIVTPEKIEVVSPRGVSKKQLHSFVESHQEWVERTCLKLKEKKKNIKKLAPDRYENGVQIPFRGQQVKIKLQQSSVKQIKIQLDREELLISYPLALAYQENSELIRLAIISWMKGQAMLDVKHYVDVYAKMYELYPRSIKIKSQKSRWGSCGIHDDININWLLVLAPSEVMEYVVVHEICHIKERNHSTRFWTLVEKNFPAYQKQRNWLKKNGVSLAL